MVRLIAAALLALCSPACLTAAWAGDIDLRLVDQAGKPVTDAVVTVVPAGGVPRKPIKFAWPYAMVQQNIAFSPHVLIVPVGTTVAFPNKDNVRHHVYSFSKAARFDMKLYGHDETRSYTFTSVGAVAIGCNIHDQMSGFIRVVATPWAAKSGPGGTVHIAGLPAGTAAVTVWHPLLRTKDNEIVVQVPIGASGTVAKSVPLTLRSAS